METSRGSSPEYGGCPGSAERREKREKREAWWMLSWATLPPDVSSGGSMRSLTSAPESARPLSQPAACAHYRRHVRLAAVRVALQSQPMPPQPPVAAERHPTRGGSDPS